MPRADQSDGDRPRGSRPSLGAVDLNLLVGLDVLLRERSVTAAAQRLAVAQPTMSGVLARLRTMFKDDLLVRSDRTMRLTPLAESLEHPVRAILAQIERTIFLEPAFDPLHDARAFTVNATDYASVVLLRPLLGILATEAPAVRLQIRSTSILDHAAQLERGDIDFAIVPSRFSRETTLPCRSLFDDRFLVATWAGNDTLGESTTLEQLEQLPYLTYRLGPLPSLVDKRLEELGHARVPDTIVEGFVTGAAMLRGTKQFTFLQERLVDLMAGPAELNTAEAPFTIPPVEETLVWHERAENEPGHRWMRERIVTLAAALPTVRQR